MGKKQNSEIPNYQREFNRVDIFRAIHYNKNSNNENMSNSNPNTSNQYSNNAYLKSNENFTNISNTREPNVWTTSSSNNAKTNNTININRTNKGSSEEASSGACPCSTKTIIIIISIVVLVLILAGVGIGLGIYFTRPKVFTECYSICGTNEYCVLGNNKNSNSTCQCKPGYTRNDFSKVCLQTSCYTNYVPYTYLNSISSQTPSEYSTLFLKPYCCPNSGYLTDSCCGVATSNANFKLSKRIIGGSPLEAGVFPWIVFITQVYRTNPNLPLQMVLNCTGSLLNSQTVLTAGHCLDPKYNFNTEFPNIQSMLRVYYGFVDKSIAFQSSVISNYERRVVTAIQHPSYNSDTLQNDLSIIKLRTPILRDVNTDYICLFNSDLTDSTVANQMLYTAGWGSTSATAQNLQYPNVINNVGLPVVSFNKCSYIDTNNKFTVKESVCAGYDASVGKDTCYADSGGPLMVQLKNQWFLYGTVSFGSYPDCAEGPAIYPRVAFYFNWISQYM